MDNDVRSLELPKLYPKIFLSVFQGQAGGAHSLKLTGRGHDHRTPGPTPTTYVIPGKVDSMGKIWVLGGAAGHALRNTKPIHGKQILT